MNELSKARNEYNKRVQEQMKMSEKIIPVDSYSSDLLDQQVYKLFGADGIHKGLLRSDTQAGTTFFKNYPKFTSNFYKTEAKEASDPPKTIELRARLENGENPLGMMSDDGGLNPQESNN